MPVLDEPIQVGEVWDILEQLGDGTGGLDGLPARVLRAARSSLAPVLASVFQLIRRDKVTIPDWSINIIVPVPKKNHASSNMDTFRGVNLGSTVAKVYASVLERRLRLWAGLPIEQRGFVKGGCCADLTMPLDTIRRTQNAKGKRLFACFVDLRKAFPSVRRPLLWHHLAQLGISAGMLADLRALYADTRATVRTASGFTSPFELPVGLREGCPLSPLLFILFTSDAPRRLGQAGLPDVGERLDLGGLDLRSLYFADDTVLLAGSLPNLQRLVDEYEKYVNEKWLVVNTAKTEWVVFHPEADDGQHDPGEVLKYAGVSLPRRAGFRYLGVWLDAAGAVDETVRRAGAQGAKALGVLRGLLYTTPQLPVELGLRTFESVVGGSALYGAEWWGLLGSLAQLRRARCDTCSSLF